MKQLYNKLRRGFISRPDVMGNISLLVLAADVNDLNGGALTANFSRLLRDPVQITLNRPLSSRTGYARETRLFKGTAVHSVHPGFAKIPGRITNGSLDYD